MRSKEFENLVDFHALNFIYLLKEYYEIQDYLRENIALLASEIDNR
ncbi:MAG: hypothetical protein GY908_11740 [Flavobacteriales bacterium]|nr:hypothetical protein [Flavobacteriales bacterium]